MQRLFLLCLTGLLSAVVAAQPALPTLQQSFAEALAAYEDGRYELAAAAFSDIRDSDPVGPLAPDALYFEGSALLAQGNDAAAIELLEHFEAMFPSHPRAFEARLALGRFYYGSGNAQAALTSLGAIVERNPPDDLAARALYWMGDSAVELNRLDDALAYYGRSAMYVRTRVAPAALYARAFLLVRVGRYDDGAMEFETLAARYPDSELARNVGLALAEVYYELGDYNRTIAEIRRQMTRLSPEAGDRANFLMAECYNQLRDSENAIIYYRRFTEANPDSPYFRRAQYGLGWNYYHEGAHQWASEEFAAVQAGGDDPLSQEALYYEAVNLQLAARPTDAVDRFTRFADEYRDHALADNARLEQGLLLYRLRRWEAANRAFGQLISQHPQSDLLGEAFMHRGNTYIALGDFDRALLMFEEAIDRNAADPGLRDRVVFQKAWLLYRGGRYDDSAEAFGALYEGNRNGPEAGEALFWAAESEFQRERYPDATRLFLAYQRDNPLGRHVEASHYALGWTYFRQSRYEDAIPEFEAFLSTHSSGSESIPYRRDAQLRLADSFFALKRYPSAIRVYGRLAEDRDDYALYQIGQAYANAGEVIDAIGTFRRLIEVHPDSEWLEESRYTLGYLFFLNQDYDQAISAYQNLVRRHPTDPLAAKAQYGIGDAHFNAGRTEAAISAYRAVLERYPTSPFASDAARSIQFALMAVGDGDRSVALIDSFATANPGSPLVDELRFRRAEVRYQSGEEDEALDDLLDFVRSARDERLLAEAYYYLGSIYADRSRNAEAQGYLEQILRRYADSPRRADAALRLGRIHLEDGQSQSAIDAFETAAEAATQTQQHIEALYGQAMGLLALNRSADAEALLQEAVREAPEDQATMSAYLGLGRIAESRGRTRQARDHYGRAADGSRGEAGAEALFRLGALIRATGDDRGALAELGRMPTLFTGYAEWMAKGYLEQARAFRALGERGEAARLYETVVELYPERPEAATAAQERSTLEN